MKAEFKEFFQFIVQWIIGEIWDKIARILAIFMISTIITAINVTDFPLWSYKFFDVPPDQFAIMINDIFDILGYISLPVTIMTAIPLFLKLVIHIIKFFIESIRDAFS